MSTVWVPPPSQDADNWQVWAELGQALADHRVACERTTTVRAGRWAEQVRTERQRPDGVSPWRAGQPVPDAALHDAIGAVQAGVAVQDLYALSRAPRLGDGNGRPNGTAFRLMSAATMVLSYLSLRALVGWVCAEAVMPNDSNRYEQVHTWAAEGLGEDGWLYAAAGFTLDETFAAKTAGTLDPGQARMMAALRGVSVPVG